jgi:hypothetical protein
MYGSRVVLFHCDSKEYFDLKSRVRSPFPFSSLFGCSRSFRSSGRGARGAETTAATAAHTAKQTVRRAQRRQAAACAHGGGDRRARADEERWLDWARGRRPSWSTPRAAQRRPAAQGGKRPRSGAGLLAAQRVGTVQSTTRPAGRRGEPEAQ